MGHDEEKPLSRLSTISRFLTPLRITSIISILSMGIFKIPFESASILFYGFSIIVFSSFSIEAIHYGKNRMKIIGLTIKYMIIISFEFIGVFVFTMSTLPFPNGQEIHELEIKITIMVLGVSMIGELYHYMMFGKEKFQIDVPRILTIILATVLSVYEAIFIYVFLLMSKSHS